MEKEKGVEIKFSQEKNHILCCYKTIELEINTKFNRDQTQDDERFKFCTKLE